MRFCSLFSAALPVAAASFVACSSATDTSLDPGRDDTSAGAITSVEAQILDFTFDGEVLADTSTAARDAVTKQLLYTFGVLNSASNASGQVGNVQLANVSETTSGDKKRLTYRATLPVAWPKDSGAPSSYTLVVPRDTTALSTFDGKYDGRCGNGSHGDGNFWHDWNPNASDCSIDDGDVVRSAAAVAPHSEAEGKYPEYDRIWEDGRLDAVAIFTIISESGDTPPNDWGITETHRFVREAMQGLEGVQVQRNGASGSVLEDITLRGATMAFGAMRDVELDVLLVRSITGAGEDFDARYNPLSEKADLILFNGHAQLGGNTNALSRKGTVTAGKYQLVLLNACDTFALVDETMLSRRREANGAADPDGTRFLDVISNARPGRSDNLANVSKAVYQAVLRADSPITYSHLISEMPSIHMAVVYGEEDNAFGSSQMMPYAAYEETGLSGGP